MAEQRTTFGQIFAGIHSDGQSRSFPTNHATDARVIGETAAGILRNVQALAPVPEDWLQEAIETSIVTYTGTKGHYNGRRAIEHLFSPFAYSLAEKLGGMETPAMQLISLIYITRAIEAKHTKVSQQLERINERTFIDTEQFTAEQNRKKAEEQERTLQAKLQQYLPQLQEGIYVFAQEQWGEEGPEYVDVLTRAIEIQSTFPGRRDKRTVLRDQIIKHIGAGNILEARKVLDTIPTIPGH